MTRNLKALGLALAAAFAFSALAASAAQAEFTFTGYESNPAVHVHTKMTGTQTEPTGGFFQLTTGKSQISCETATGTATSTTGADATVTFTPTLAGCKASIGFLTVEYTTCDYRNHITGKVNEHEYTGTIDIVCLTPGDAIHITVFTTESHTTKICDFTLDEQSGVGGITYINKTDKAHKYVEVQVNQHTTHTTTIKGGNILCQTPTGTTHTESVLVGTGIVTCENALGAEINCTVSG